MHPMCLAHLLGKPVGSKYCTGVIICFSTIPHGPRPLYSVLLYLATVEVLCISLQRDAQNTARVDTMRTSSMEEWASHCDIPGAVPDRTALCTTSPVHSCQCREPSFGCYKISAPICLGYSNVCMIWMRVFHLQ